MEKSIKALEDENKTLLETYKSFNSNNAKYITDIMTQLNHWKSEYDRVCIENNELRKQIEELKSQKRSWGRKN